MRGAPTDVVSQAQSSRRDGTDAGSDPGAQAPAAALEDRPTRLRRLVPAATAALCYFVLACLVFWPVAPLDNSHIVSCACSDPAQEVWFLSWTSFAVTHWLNPFFTTYLHAPKGANLGINTSMPLLGLLGLPVTLAAGPIATYNVLLRIAFAASGTSMFLLLRRYASWPVAAFAGGLLFAFSPFMVGQGSRHLFLVFLPIPPLVIALVDDWLITCRRGAVRSGLLLGLAGAAQCLISTEVLLMTALVVAALLVILAIRYPAACRERARRAVEGFSAALGVFILLAGYPLWMLLFGPERTVGPPHALSDLARYHDDLLAPIVPTVSQLLGPIRFSRVGSSFAAHSLVENGLYLGIPLVMVLGFFAVRYRRIGIVAVSTIGGLAGFVLSLGSPLLVDNHRIPAVPMPFAIFTHVPILQDIEPARFSLFVPLAGSIVLAVGLDRIRFERWHLRSRPSESRPDTGVRRVGPSLRSSLATGAIALVALTPLIPRAISSVPAGIPSFFLTSDARSIPSGTLALTFPFDKAPFNDPMLWQAASGMRFRIIGGDAFVPGRGGRGTYRPDPPGPTVISKLLLAGSGWAIGHPPPDDASTIAAVRQLLARQHVDVVLVLTSAPDGPYVATVIRRALGRAPVGRGGMDIWLSVPSSLRRKALG